MNKKKFKILIPVSIVAVCIYLILLVQKFTSGGELAIDKVTTSEYILVGVEFNGSADQQAFRDAYEKVDTEKANDSLPTYMVHYEMEEPTKENKFHINAFIGYVTQDTSASLTAGHEYRILHQREVVRATSVAGLIFQGRIYPKLEEYFAEHQLGIDSSYIVEKYWKDNKIAIEMGVK